jgi:TonB family protein
MAAQPPASKTPAAGFGDAVSVTETSPATPLKASAGFASATTAEPSRGPARAVSAVPARTAIEILFKPRPAYTEEARKLSIQGDVVLLARFGANGQVEVERVLRGLGHGLDQSASCAAEAIRFRPATEYGRPVDASATVRITFQLAN